MPFIKNNVNMYMKTNYILLLTQNGLKALQGLPYFCLCEVLLIVSLLHH